MSESNSQSKSSSEEKPVKHVVADTLEESSAAVVVVEKPVGNDTVENYYVGLDDGYAEILPANPRAKRIKRFTLCQRIDGLPENADLSVKAKPQLDRTVQSDIESKIAPLQEDNEKDSRKSRTPRTKAPEKADELDKAVRDDPTEVLDVASAPAGTSEEHGGGW